VCRLGGNGFDEAFSAGAYEGALRKLIHLFEFEGVRPLARPLSGLLVQALPRERPFDLIAPMPPDWRRLGRRGFHHSELLAGEIARRDRLAGVERGLVLAAASGSGRQ
jgi:predicted amidophosphoribosyltransferase